MDNSGSFKKCDKGHVYESVLVECPYCNGKKIETDLEDLPEKPGVDPNIGDDIADCYFQIAGDIDDDNDDKW